MFGFAWAWPLARVAALIGVCWALFAAGRQRFDWQAPAPAPDEVREGVTRTTLMIPTPSGERIEGWLYRSTKAPAPLVIMAPGLCGTKEGPLEAFAWGLSARGFCALAIDFRSFGGSEGRLRHSIDLRAHVALAAAPGVRAAFDALSYTARRERALAVESAKQAETRQRRIAKIIAELTP